MEKIEQMYTFSDLKKVIPLKERALRALLSKLGFHCRKGQGKLIFSTSQVLEIQDAVACKRETRLSATEDLTGISDTNIRPGRKKRNMQDLNWRNSRHQLPE